VMIDVSMFALSRSAFYKGNYNKLLS